MKKEHEKILWKLAQELPGCFNLAPFLRNSFPSMTVKESYKIVKEWKIVNNIPSFSIGGIYY
jgi:hypothetical protein